MNSIAESTDPGTRRPDEASFSQSGADFQPLLMPSRCMQISPISTTNAHNPFALWQLFFTPNHMHVMMTHTNENAKLYYANNTTEYVHARLWYAITIQELYTFFAIHIYMGIHKEPRIPNYWNQQSDKPLHPLIYRTMSYNQFEMIDRFFHVSDPQKSTPGDPFSKLEPLKSHVMSIAKEHWYAGRGLALDECIQRFQGEPLSLQSINSTYRLILLGRSKDTLTIPKKPTPTGYEIWALAEEGYILHLIWHRKTRGPVGLPKKPPEGLNLTQAVVPYLLRQLSPDLFIYLFNQV